VDDRVRQVDRRPDHPADVRAVQRLHELLHEWRVAPESRHRVDAPGDAATVPAWRVELDRDLPEGQGEDHGLERADVPAGWVRAVPRPVSGGGGQVADAD